MAGRYRSAHSHKAPARLASIAPQNPITRIEQVARDLGELAEQVEEHLGPEAKRALLYWRSELHAAIDEPQQRTDAP
jgi:hypothetical protein